MGSESTLHERFAKVESKVDMLMSDMYNGGSGDGTGVKGALFCLITKLDTRDEAQAENLKTRDDERENRQKRRDFWITTAIAFMMVILGFLAYLEANRQVKGGELSWPKITSTAPEQYAHSKQPQQISGGFEPLNAQRKGQ